MFAPSDTKAKTIMVVKTIEDYTPPDKLSNALPLEIGNIIYVLNNNNKHWWDGVVVHEDGVIKRGWFPATSVKPYRHFKSKSLDENIVDKFKKDTSTTKPINTTVEETEALSTEFTIRDPMTLNTTNQNPLPPSNLPYQQRRQSLRPRQLSQTSNYSNFKQYKSSPSQSNSILESYNISSSSKDFHNVPLHPLPTIPSSNSSSSTGVPIFKEKNYFISRNDSSLSQTSQSALNDSRQSSKAFTERSFSSTINSIPLISRDEIASYFSTTYSQSQPGLNFIPIWHPKFNENFDVVFHNKALNVYSNEPPFIDADHINDRTLFESAETVNIQDELKYIDFETASESNETSFKKSISSNMQKSSNFDSSRENISGAMHSVITLAGLSNVKPSEVFYLESSDFVTWDTLISNFINSLDNCISNLKNHDKLNFSEALNNASNCLLLYHTAGRLLQQQLIDSNCLSKFSLVIKKITNMFIQFRIWSNLAAIAVDAFDSYNSVQSLKVESIDVNEENIVQYIEDIVYYRNKLEKLSLYLVKLMSTVNLKFSNSITDKHHLKMLPMIYARFLRNNFEGGNFRNKFVSLGQQSFSNNDSNLNSGNRLLDDHAIDSLKSYEKKILSFLKEVKDILSEKLSPNIQLKKFTEDRNLRLLTCIYKMIPVICSFTDLIETIDLTVFAMIDKFATRNLHPDRNETIVSTNESDSIRTDRLSSLSHLNLDESFSPNLSETNRFTGSSELEKENFEENDNDIENDSQSFYDATAKVFRPMIQEFLQLKQAIHSSFTDLILDAQTITSADPETFFSIRKDKASLSKENKLEIVADLMLEKLEKIDVELYNDGLYTSDSSLKLFETIKLTKERINLVIESVSQLKDERTNILNYCSRLMNSDFNIASLFIAERHNTLVSKMSQSSQSFKTNSTTSNDNFDLQHKEDKVLHDDFFNSSNPVTEYNVNVANSNVPWFLRIDRDHQNLVYEASTLKGGTVKALVSILVNPLEQSNQLYEETFLCFFPTFTRPTKLFELLIDNYFLTMPEALSYEEYGIWLEQKLKPQQQRVLGIFHKLFTCYWLVDYTTSDLIRIWDTFTSEAQFEDVSLIDIANKVFTFIRQEDYFKYFNLINDDPKHIPLAPSTTSISKVKVQDLGVTFVASQITAIQAFYFRKLNLWDLLGRSYNFVKVLKKKNDKGNFINSRDPLGTKNVSIFIRNCNHLTHYTTYMILKSSELIERVEIIKFFISVAEKLLQLKNYSSMTAIISGLSSTSISRLKKTWEKVPESFVSKFHKMDNLMSIGKNYSEYRNITKFVESDNDAYLPFLGMYLSDLRFTTDGNPDWLSPKKGTKGIVNFSKRMNIMKIIKEVLNFNKTLYDIELDLSFSRYMYEMFNRLPDDEKLYELSIKIEPRVSLLKSKAKVSKGTIDSSAFSIGSSDISDPLFINENNSLLQPKVHSNLKSSNTPLDQNKLRSYRPLVSMVNCDSNDNESGSFEKS